MGLLFTSLAIGILGLGISLIFVILSLIFENLDRFGDIALVFGLFFTFICAVCVMFIVF